MNINWMCEIETYLRMGELPEEEKQTHKIRVQAARFTLIGDNLHRRSFGGPYLKCLNDLEAQYVLVELHEGFMWQSCRRAHLSTSRSHAGVQLAHHEAKHREVYQKV